MTSENILLCFKCYNRIYKIFLNFRFILMEDVIFFHIVRQLDLGVKLGHKKTN